MRIKLIHEEKGQRTFAVILETGDEAMSCLGAFAARERIGGAQVTAIGAFRKSSTGGNCSGVGSMMGSCLGPEETRVANVAPLYWSPCGPVSMAAVRKR